MNDIEVGEYIRTNQGHIGVLKRIEFDRNDKSLKWCIFDKKEFEINTIKEECVNKPYIVKHSKNIIDLIEISDYVNGEKVLRIDDIESKDKKLFVIFKFGETEHCKIWSNSDIKSMVTKEQFEQVQYNI